MPINKTTMNRITETFDLVILLCSDYVQNNPRKNGRTF